jgi:hypothetical protein
MVIGAAYRFTSSIREFEDDSILLVHSDTIKASEISPQFFQPVAGRYPQIFDNSASIEQIEFLLQSAPKLASDLAGRSAIGPMINVGGRRIPKAGDHTAIIPEYSLPMYDAKWKCICV